MPIPKHLSQFKWKPSFLFDMKNTTKDKATGKWVNAVSWDITDEAAENLIHEAGVKSIEPFGLQVASNEKHFIVTVGVMLTMPDGRRVGDVASTSTMEYTGYTDRKGEHKEDRRKFYLAQMAYTRAKGRAICSAIGCTNDDLLEIAKELGIAPTGTSRGPSAIYDEPTTPDVPATNPDDQLGDVEAAKKLLGL